MVARVSYSDVVWWTRLGVLVHREEHVRRAASRTFGVRDVQRGVGAGCRGWGVESGDRPSGWMHCDQVAVWRRRYERFGLAGLVDEGRSGRPVIYGHDDVLQLVKTVSRRVGRRLGRWTMEALAVRMAADGVAISASQVWRVYRSLGLKPWQTESWMTSHDPDLGEGGRCVWPGPRSARQRDRLVG